MGLSGLSFGLVTLRGAGVPVRACHGVDAETGVSRIALGRSNKQSFWSGWVGVVTAAVTLVGPIACFTRIRTHMNNSARQNA